MIQVQLKTLLYGIARISFSTDKDQNTRKVKHLMHISKDQK